MLMSGLKGLKTVVREQEYLESRNRNKCPWELGNGGRRSFFILFPKIVMTKDSVKDFFGFRFQLYIVSQKIHPRSCY